MTCVGLTDLARGSPGRTDADAFEIAFGRFQSRHNHLTESALAASSAGTFHDSHDAGPSRLPMRRAVRARNRLRPADSAFTPINVRMARDPGAFGARLGSCELRGGCCCEVLARFVISRHGTGTDVIYPAMQGEITLFQSSHHRGM
jgi:hypothetical protein